MLIRNAVDQRSLSWVAPSLLEFGIVMGLVTPSVPKSAHVFKDVKFEFESDLPVSCLVSPSIPLELGLNDSYPVDWHVLSGLPFQLTFWNTVDVAAFPDPAASIVLRSGVVCRNVMPSSRSCTLELFALVCAVAFCGRLLSCLGIPDGEYGVEQSAAALFFLFQDQVSRCAAAASLGASLVPHGYCVAVVFFNFLASVFVTIYDMEQSRLGSCEMLGKSQSKDMKVLYFFESLWFLLHQVFLFSACFGIQGASLVGAAAAWTLGASSYFQKQVICLVAAACTSHAFCHILALDVLDVLMRLGQFACIVMGAAAAWTSDASSYFQKQVICLVAAACTSHAFCHILALDVLDVLMRLGQFACIVMGAAAAWTSDASAYFQKQVMCLVAAACTTHAFCYILALDGLDVLMRLGQSVCFFPDVDVLSDFVCELGCSAAAALECDFCLVNPESVLGSDGEVGHNTASSLTAGMGDQASGRVDVPGGVPQLASISSQVFWKVLGQFETEHEVHQTNCDIGKSATFQVLVKQLSGQHLAVSVHSCWLVADLAYCLQLRCLQKLSTW